MPKLSTNARKQAITLVNQDFDNSNEQLKKLCDMFAQDLDFKPEEKKIEKKVKKAKRILLDFELYFKKEHGMLDGKKLLQDGLIIVERDEDGQIIKHRNLFDADKDRILIKEG